MSYDELLARFTRPEALIPSGTTALALYAVIELHHPSSSWDEELVSHCFVCSRADLVPYPCPTIRDIERVFGLSGSGVASEES